jgi:hypothetical protein
MLADARMLEHLACRRDRPSLIALVRRSQHVEQELAVSLGTFGLALEVADSEPHPRTGTRAGRRLCEFGNQLVTGVIPSSPIHASSICRLNARRAHASEP